MTSSIGSEFVGPQGTLDEPAGRRPTTFAGHGLTIRSDFELALRPTADSDRPIDMDIRWGEERRVTMADPAGELLARLSDGEGGVRFVFARDQDRTVLRYPGLCEFVGDRSLGAIHTHLHPGTEPGIAAVLAAGAVLAVYLTLAGHFVLHASAIEVDGRAIAFVGSSGMGKSTLAALMVAQGYPLVTDDVLRTAVQEANPDAPVLVFPGGVEGRLRDKARDIAATVANAATRETADGRLSLRPTTSTATSLPLAACVVPFPSPTQSEVSIRRLRPALALQRLIQFPRIVGWSHRDILTREFQAAGELAARVPLYEAHIPWGPPFGSGITDALLRGLDLM